MIVLNKALHIVTASFFVLGSIVYAGDLSDTYSIQFIGGTFHGPGQMQDVPMPNGAMHIVKLNKKFSGVTPYFNNGAEELNISSTVHKDGRIDGLLSDGTPYNEYMDGGVVDVGNGALKLLNVVTRDGPHNGTQKYSLSSQCNWEITTDLALDPGFEHGILVTENLMITSGSVWIPPSLQSKYDMPGGVNIAGSLPTGTPLIGRLGDENIDGFLDGTVVGISVIPIDHIFYPGAPVAQSREFKSNIPVSNSDALALTIYGIINYREVFNDIFRRKNFGENSAYSIIRIVEYLKDIENRIHNASALLTQTSIHNNKRMINKIDSLKEDVEELIYWAMGVMEGELKAIPKENAGKIERLLDNISAIAEMIQRSENTVCGGIL